MGRKIESEADGSVLGVISDLGIRQIVNLRNAEPPIGVDTYGERRQFVNLRSSELPIGPNGNFSPDQSFSGESEGGRGEGTQQTRKG